MLNGNFLKTEDGGNIWQIVANVTLANFTGFYKMQLLDTLTGYCATPDGLLKTINGGKTWTNCLPVTGLSSNFIIPRFFDVNNGYCMTSDGIYKTTNGGVNWTTSCRISSHQFSGIHFLDMNTGWACTFDGYVYSLKP